MYPFFCSAVAMPLQRRCNAAATLLQRRCNAAATPLQRRCSAAVVNLQRKGKKKGPHKKEPLQYYCFEKQGM